MTKFKGTKGKWKVVFDKHDYELKVRNEETTICMVKPKSHDDEEEANALLISKAPEMLEILVRTSNLIDSLNCSVLVDEIEQLIKEATEL